jgi:HEAT repeat protein
LQNQFDLLKARLAIHPNRCIESGLINAVGRQICCQMSRHLIASCLLCATAFSASLLAQDLEDVPHQLVRVVTNRNVPATQRIAAINALISSGRLPLDSITIIVGLAVKSAEDLQLRNLALDALGRTGADAASAVPQLCSLLVTPGEDLEVRRRAAQTIGEVASAAKIRFPVDILATVLRDRNTIPVLRVEVAHSLQIMGETARSTVPALQEVLNERSEPRDLRVAVLDAIPAIARGAHSLSPDLENIVKDSHEDVMVRTKAARALGAVGVDENVVTVLVDVITDTSANLELRIGATEPLMSQLPAAKRAASALRAILKDPKQNSELRRNASQALAAIKSGSQDDIKTIIDILRNPGEPLELRKSVASSAGALGAQAADAAPVLAQIMSDSHTDVLLRRTSADALMQIRPTSSSAMTVITVLRRIIYDGAEDLELRRKATWVLGRIGSDDHSTDPQLVPVLLDVLNNGEDSVMRTYALGFLRQMEPGRSKLILSLIQTAENPQEEPEIRFQAISALGNIGSNYSVADALPGLLRLLASDKEELGLRVGAEESLAMIQPEPQTAIPVLLKILQDSEQVPQLRSSAAQTLGAIGQESRPAASALASVVRDRNEERTVRMNAMQALGRLGPTAKPFLDLLLRALYDPDVSIQSSAVAGLSNFVDAVSAEGATNLLKDVERIESAIAIKPGIENLKLGDGDAVYSPVPRIHQDRVSLERQAASNLKKAVAEFVLYRHPRIFICVALVLFWWLSTAVLLWVSPLTLLKISEKFSGLSDVRVPIGKISVPVDKLPIYLFPRYPRRALDKWVSYHAANLKANFERIPKVKERANRVSLPVRIDNTVIHSLDPKDLQTLFGQQRCYVLVTGEGGGGKTSLACQIGKWSINNNGRDMICDHRMLPVFIEDDINVEVKPGEDVFLEIIRGRLTHLIDEVEAPTSVMVASLLRERRILVIVDGFSEMTEDARQRIHFASPRFPVNALLLTSRLNESLQAIAKTTLTPQRLDGSDLSVFVDDYLRGGKKSGLFPGKQLHALCADLQTMIADRDITPLLAKLYIDNRVALRENGNSGSAPNDIPGLFLEYLNRVNQSVRISRLDNARVHQIVKIVAWECVRAGLHPIGAQISSVESALGTVHATHEDLKYLEERLSLIETVPPGEHIRFGLDPLAEYLAALHLVDRNGTNEARWREFLAQADGIPNSRRAIHGFLRAVADCYWSRYPNLEADFFSSEIRRRIDDRSSSSVSSDALRHA